MLCLSREDRRTFNMEWMDNDTVLRYSTNITYTFDPSKSNGYPDSDLVTTINVPLFVSKGGVRRGDRG